MAQTSRTPTYCTPEDVAEVLDLPDPLNPNEVFMFTDKSHPSYERVEKYILTAEDEIDRRTRRSWRVNRVSDYVASIPNYQWDENGWRSAYYQSGGYMIQLRKNILPWDPDSGDKLELRMPNMVWRDISEEQLDDSAGQAGVELFWFDAPAGRLFLKTRLMQQKFNALRISYRYGNEGDNGDDEAVPAAISDLAAMIAATKVVARDLHSIKVGMGGDVSGIRDQLLSRFNLEIANIYTSYQRSGTVHSMYR